VGTAPNGSGQRLRRLLDSFVTRLTAGLRPADLHALARGETLPRPDPRYRVHTASFWFHIKPRYYHQAATRFTYTFRLGLLCTLLCLVEAVTGLFLMLYYAPVPERAYGDIVALMSRVPFGQLVRDVHRLASDALVVVVVLHLARTFLTGSYKAPRRFTWVTGVILLLATLFMSFSGYLLPWDQLAYWAVTIGTSLSDRIPPAALGSGLKLLLLGGSNVGASALLRFYMLHVVVVPMGVVILFAVHYFKVVRTGLSLPANEERVGQDTARRVPADRRRYYIPDILSDEIVFLEIVLVILLGVIILGVYRGAPLERHADPLNTPLGASAPWYFLWLQGLLKLGDPTLLGVIVPALFITLLLILPYIDRNPSRRSSDRRGAIYLFGVICVIFAILTWMGRSGFGAPLPAAEAVVQEILPEEGIGPVRALSWVDLQAGEWDTRTYPISMAGPGLRAVMARYDRLIEGADAGIPRRGTEGLPGGYGKLVIENWQPGLKKVVLRIFWWPAGRGEQVFEKSAFIHQAASSTE
jgi:ubiquinol-cytochrome c reductase cytochrome b subunit